MKGAGTCIDTFCWRSQDIETHNRPSHSARHMMMIPQTTQLLPTSKKPPRISFHTNRHPGHEEIRSHGIRQALQIPYAPSTSTIILDMKKYEVRGYDSRYKSPMFHPHSTPVYYGSLWIVIFGKKRHPWWESVNLSACIFCSVWHQL